MFLAVSIQPDVFKTCCLVYKHAGASSCPWSLTELAWLRHAISRNFPGIAPEKQNGGMGAYRSMKRVIAGKWPTSPGGWAGLGKAEVRRAGSRKHRLDLAGQLRLLSTSRISSADGLGATRILQDNLP